MADNTDEGHIDNPTENQLENPSDEIIPTTGTETITQNQETENMEVHHHAHDSEVPHHKKNWKSYFWEFLMLFLAVFCGFLAEYQLEHTIEHQREREYIKTMVEDLKSDTAQLTRLIGIRKERVIELDSLFELISSDRYKKEGNKVYSLYEFPYWDINRFLPSDRTMQQLKNSGNLRLIRKEIVSNALIHYDVWVRNRKEYESLQVELATQINPVIENLLDPKVLHDAKKVIINTRLASDTNVNNLDYSPYLPRELTIPQMGAANKKAILKYLNEVILLYTELRNDNISEKKLAIKTLDLIIKEYNVE